MAFCRPLATASLYFALVDAKFTAPLMAYSTMLLVCFSAGCSMAASISMETGAACTRGSISRL